MYQRLSNGEPVIKLHPMASNELPDGTTVYARIHGVKHSIQAGQTHVFNFQIPYNYCFFQGAEVIKNVTSTVNFTIKEPVNQSVVGQYGLNVNTGDVAYKREAQYAAKIPMGIILSCEVKNETLEEIVFGVNFILHEIVGAQ